MATAHNADNLVWKHWDDSEFWVVFHLESRQTHILDEISAAVLRSLSDGPVRIEDVVEQLIRDFGIDPEARSDALSYVAKAVRRFIESGLIRGPAQ